MDILKTLPIILLIFFSGCATQVNETAQTTQQQEQQAPTALVQEEPTGGTLQGQVNPPQEQSPPSLPETKEFMIEADDRSFYIDNAVIHSVSVNKGNIVKIAFKVREAGTYYGGLDFRGCGQDMPDTKPGASTEMQFTADSTCTITSYWPSSGVVKDNMQIIVS